MVLENTTLPNRVATPQVHPRKPFALPLHISTESVLIVFMFACADAQVPC